MTIALQAAQQQLDDARAALAQLNSQRIEAKSAVATAHTRKLAAKSDQGAFRAANAAHADAEADLERVGLLVADAAQAVRDAENSAQAATIKDAEETFAAQAREALAHADQFAKLHGEYLAAYARLSLARERALTNGYAVQRAASKAAVTADVSALNALEMAGDLIALAPMVGNLSLGVSALRNKAHADSVLVSMRTALGYAAPPTAPGYGFAPTAQITDMIAGTYVSRCEVIAGLLDGGSDEVDPVN